MKRNEFIKKCCYASIGIPLMTSVLQSCGALYYAENKTVGNIIYISKDEFINLKNNKKRKYILISNTNFSFPICLYKTDEINYTASLMRCTHNGCELNIGAGIYSCPCHGSEFTPKGEVIEGPATDNLKTFKTETNEKNILIYIN
ncbi:MAG: Rieske 2Fe-2S domain-containing protein [Flavobacteriaceae bacterium]|nr:Rieske 2Fe-2S domain-containing protein [Flavobacteriaceae bacterium]